MRTDDSWSVSLLGTPTLHRLGAGTTQVVPLCHQSGILLASLALARDGARSRDELSQALWDEPAAARAACLSTAVWRLRQTLETAPFDNGAVLCASRDGRVSLSVGAPIRIDVGEYLRALQQPLALPPGALDDAAAALLAAATKRYAGDLLSGLQDAWVLREREKLRRHQIDALRRLLQWSVQDGDVATGIGHGLAILELDELREDIHRELMRLYMQAGLRALALRQYERCRGALRRELAIGPMPQTQALFQQIVDNAIDRSVTTALTSAAGKPTAVMQPPAPIATEFNTHLGAARRHLAAADVRLVRASRSMPH